MPNSRMLPATSSNVCVITCRSSSGVDDTAMEPAFSISARYSAVADDRRYVALQHARSTACGVPAPAQMPSQP